MKYRLLEPDEWNKLDDLLDPAFIPRPDAATAAVCETDEGVIVGALFLQLQLHMEPLVIEDSRVDFRRLHDVLHSAVSNQPGLAYYAFTERPKIARMAELVGMTRQPYEVWRKEVE